MNEDDDIDVGPRAAWAGCLISIVGASLCWAAIIWVAIRIAHYIQHF